VTYFLEEAAIHDLVFREYQHPSPKGQNENIVILHLPGLPLILHFTRAKMKWSATEAMVLLWPSAIRFTGRSMRPRPLKEQGYKVGKAFRQSENRLL
jgi:hypothetical protein